VNQLKKIEDARDEPKEEAQSVEFTWLEEGEEVLIAGSFNGWTKVPMEKQNDKFVVNINLKPGVYEFKYFVDNEWLKRDDLDMSENKENNIIEIN